MFPLRGDSHFSSSSWAPAEAAKVASTAAAHARTVHIRTFDEVLHRACLVRCESASISLSSVPSAS